MWKNIMKNFIQSLEFEKLTKLYTDFVEFYKQQLKEILKEEKIEISKEEFEEAYENHWKHTFVEFWRDVKHFIFSSVPIHLDAWDCLIYLRFLKKAKLKQKKWLRKILLPPLEKSTIEDILERKLKVKLNSIKNKSVFYPFVKIGKFELKEGLDQFPISLESALLILEKITYHYPFKFGFGEFGVDDLISVYLSLIFNNFHSFCFDKDSELLSLVKKIALAFNLKIETTETDFENFDSKLNLLGFYTNPPYTLAGLKTFVKAGLKSLSSLGGFILLVYGTEGLAKQEIIFQNFLSKKLIIEEIVQNISYPFHEKYEEVKRLKKLAGKLKLRIKSYLHAKLCVLHFIPWKIKKIEKGMFFYF